MHSSALPLLGKTALVTGVSRRRGIGYAVARRLATLGASIFFHHYRPHDLDLPWGGDDLDAIRAGIRDVLHPSALSGDLSADLTDANRVAALIDSAVGLTGSLDILVCNHAKSGDDGGILDMTPDRLDAFWRTNAQSTLLLTAEFAKRKTDVGTRAQRRPGERAHRDGPFVEPVGRVFWMTSGQLHGPLRGEVAYAASKAALAGVTTTVAAELLDLGIVLNTINPGPVNTGYMDPDTADRPLDALKDLLATTPFGRYGRPEDPAELIGWLSTDSGAWIVGQVITSDGGLSIN
ncbi:SDR family oxidoreductase [Microbacterium sp. SORGH_AS_0888]|uniref:SDR family oxidoreductase n=1 Tax=Microbacterium sp. SORGH_AS_0888 TaxID=3041791 RepID=UPI002780970B|nr:SDR family oxidoreductase [Microbacterium sp. SORGH_AS_0888]MDQ1131140.1 3-oxoacyl-[acyl-carrier protein] reductase [Microbacterium sp. SORGH_AS_0888]